MQGLQIELIFPLDGDETHVLPLHGFGNRFRIAVIILVRLHERPHKLRRDRAPLVPLPAMDGRVSTFVGQPPAFTPSGATRRGLEDEGKIGTRLASARRKSHD